MGIVMKCMTTAAVLFVLAAMANSLPIGQEVSTLDDMHTDAVSSVFDGDDLEQETRELTQLRGDANAIGHDLGSSNTESAMDLEMDEKKLTSDDSMSSGANAL